MNQSELILQSHDDNLIQKLNWWNKNYFTSKYIYKLYNSNNNNYNNNNNNIIVHTKMFWFFFFFWRSRRVTFTGQTLWRRRWREEEQGMMGYDVMWPPLAASSPTIHSEVSLTRENLWQWRLWALGRGWRRQWRALRQTLGVRRFEQCGDERGRQLPPDSSG